MFKKIILLFINNFIKFDESIDYDRDGVIYKRDDKRIGILLIRKEMLINANIKISFFRIQFILLTEKAREKTFYIFKSALA